MTVFSVWAPDADSVVLDLSGKRLPMARETGARGHAGYWTVDAPVAGHGTDYGFVVDGSAVLPDPRSRWQPDGVHGASRVYDHDRYRWQDGSWTGRPLAGGVVYELHIGTFTPEGTFDAAIERLGHLVDLGITSVEVLPVASFPGRHGWGYDGVDLWAAHEPYGGPDGFKRFVDACHGRGLAVILDVVYNHLGPSGNYLGEFGPYFTTKHVTPWGPAVNLDDAGSDEVRAFVIDNATAWLRDFHVDGLRLDAVHALVDDRAVHLLEQLSEEVDALAVALNRPLCLIAESDLNDPRIVRSREAGGFGVHAQWSDDFHHALHTLLTGERQGYYGDFGSLATLARVLESVFLHADRWSSFRGRSHGRPVDRRAVPGWRFLGYVQDHDQIGNRAVGDRITATLSCDEAMVAAAIVLTSPFTPMLFMGEEWAAGTPWQFFSDHQEPELADKVRSGRRAEFAAHGWAAAEVPDPQDPATFERSRLDWGELSDPDSTRVLDWYRRLISLRRQEADLNDPRLDRVLVSFDEQARWLVVHRGRHRTAVNLADVAQDVPLDGPVIRVVAASRPEETKEAAGEAGAALALPPRSVAIVAVDAAA